MSDYWQNYPRVTWFDDNTLNIAYNVVDRHISTPNKNKTALILESEHGISVSYTFLDLFLLSNKFANLLTKKKIAKGDRVFLFLPRVIELYAGFIGILKKGAIAGTLFSAFGQEALLDRLQNSGARIVFTTKDLYPKLSEIKNNLSNLDHIYIVDSDEFQKELSTMSSEFETVHMNPDDPSFMLYTSGTTGKPKGIVHTHYALLQQIESARVVLDLKENDTYWCTADPGWVTGIVYGILSNLSLGITSFVYSGRFNPEKWYSLIEKHKITVWYSAPTAIRMLMAGGENMLGKYNLSSLRHLASVGEPLNPEAVIWSQRVFKKPFHDTWWQTENGSILIANIPGMKIKPGSMGKPLPWITADIIDEQGKPLPPNTEGNLAFRFPWPSLMKTVWSDTNRYNEYFSHGWYLSGDKAKKDADGYFWFIGRKDDVINTSGKRVGPFEVESVLIEHPAVIEAGVIGKPDAVRGEIIKAFVVLHDTTARSDNLIIELQNFVKTHLGAHAYPREIEFVASLPKTRSGKIMRRVLKARELNLPTGDISTIEEY